MEFKTNKKKIEKAKKTKARTKYKKYLDIWYIALQRKKIYVLALM